MSDAIVVAIIAATASVFSAVCTLIGVSISNKRSKQNFRKDLEIGQAVTDEKLTELTREVRKHNGFAERMPVIEEQIKVINHRIGDLECYHKPN